MVTPNLKFRTGSRRIQELLELLHGLSQPVGAAESLGDLDRCSELVQRRHLENTKVVELADAVLGVLL